MEGNSQWTVVGGIQAAKGKCPQLSEHAIILFNILTPLCLERDCMVAEISIKLVCDCVLIHRRVISG